MKKIVCPVFGKASTISEWNKKTNRFYSPLCPVEKTDEMGIDVISENYFDEYGLCTIKGDVNSSSVTEYVCLKCESEIHSYNLKMVDVVEEDDNSSCLVCKKCGGHNLYFAVDTFAKFNVNPDCSIGEVILNKDGVDCICSFAATESEHIRVHRRDCCSAFHIEYSDDGRGGKYKIGSEI